MRIEKEIATIKQGRNKVADSNPVSMDIVLKYAKFFAERLDYLLLQQSDPIKIANFFGVLFNKLPTYQDIVDGTNNIANLTGVNELFKLKNINQSALVPLLRFERRSFP
jgi:hypothetical protein